MPVGARTCRSRPKEFPDPRDWLGFSFAIIGNPNRHNVNPSVVAPKMKRSTGGRLQYAEGYASLGMFSEAVVELSKIEISDIGFPEVLEAWMHIRYCQERWTSLLELSTRYRMIFPKRREGWINLAFATRRIKGVSEAKDVLLQAESLLGGADPLILYNLACYHAQCGELDYARRRLECALALQPEMRDAALRDDDLVALRDEIARRSDSLS